MKAVFINDLNNGGAEKVISKLSRSYGKEHVLIRIWPEIFNPIHCNNTHVLLNKRRSIFFDLFLASWRLYKFVKLKNITAINSNLFWANYINVFISLFIGHKTICTHSVSFE